MTWHSQSIHVMHVHGGGEVLHIFHTYFVRVNAKRSGPPRSWKGLTWSWDCLGLPRCYTDLHATSALHVVVMDPSGLSPQVGKSSWPGPRGTLSPSWIILPRSTDKVASKDEITWISLLHMWVVCLSLSRPIHNSLTSAGAGGDTSVPRRLPCHLTSIAWPSFRLARARVSSTVSEHQDPKTSLVRKRRDDVPCRCPPWAQQCLATVTRPGGQHPKTCERLYLLCLLLPWGGERYPTTEMKGGWWQRRRRPNPYTGPALKQESATFSISMDAPAGYLQLLKGVKMHWTSSYHLFAVLVSTPTSQCWVAFLLEKR